MLREDAINEVDDEAETTSEVSKTEEEIKAQVRTTVIHEIGHHFGLSEEDLKK